MLSKAAVPHHPRPARATISSPFLKELPDGEVKIFDRTGLADLSRSTFEPHEESAHSPFRTGQRVRHPTFGIGRIAELSDMGSDTRAVVRVRPRRPKDAGVAIRPSCCGGVICPPARFSLRNSRTSFG